MHVLYFIITIFSHCWVLLLVLHLLKKKKRERENGIYTVHVILNTDFVLLNHRQITLPKYLEQITQEFLFLPSRSSFLKKSSNKSSMLSIAPKLLQLKSSRHHYHFNLPLKYEHLIISCYEKKFTQMTRLIWPLLTLIKLTNPHFLALMSPEENSMQSNQLFVSWFRVKMHENVRVIPHFITAYPVLHIKIM